MLVDVFLLRREGEKLSPEAVRSAPPVRGHLRITTLHRGARRSPDLAALTTWATLAEGPELQARRIMGLDDVRVTKICAEGLVMVGFDLDTAPTQRRPKPQAWWCRPVPVEAEAPRPVERQRQASEVP